MSDTTPVLDRDDSVARVERVISRISDLPTIPNSLLRIWEILDDPNSSASDLERVISLDQALSAKLIRLANSPYYGARDEITSCARAITLLGFNMVKNIAMCVSVVAGVMPKKGTTVAIDLGQLWQHSIATGVIASFLANRSDEVNPDSAFTAGVLHDLGKYVMNLCLGEKYCEVVAAARENGISIHDAELSMIGASHGHFGAYLARNWGFPEVLRDVIERHHEDFQHDGALTLLELVGVADQMARKAEVGWAGDDIRGVVDIKTMDRLQVPHSALDEFWEVVLEQVENARDLMHLIS